MTRRFLCETTLDGYRVLSVGPQLVYDSWDQMNVYLRGALGEAHAKLFAEPRTTAGVTAWTATTDVEPLPVSALPDAAREAALLRLGALMDDIDADATAKAASRKMEDQRWAALLRAIQTVPMSRDIADILYVAGEQPILVQWGTRDENRTEETATLRDKIAAVVATPRTRGVAPPAPSSPAGNGAATVLASGPTVHPGGAGWLGALLLWLAFIALLAAIYWKLLLACVVALPGLDVGTCAISQAAAARAPVADRQELERTLDALRAGVAQAPQCRVQTAFLPPEVPETVVPVPAPPPAADPESDLDRARERAGGEVGDVTMTLLWNGRSDLDLMIHCPGGGTVTSWGGPACGGEVDVDANRCARRSNASCADYRSPPIADPVENAFFNRNGALPGTYRVEVRNFAGASDSPGAQVPFALQIRRGEHAEILRGALGDGQSAMVATFTIE